MLKPPHSRYNNLHIYNINTSQIIIDDPDLIGIWKEKDSALIFFHINKDELMNKLSKKYGFKIIFYSKIPYHEWESGKFIESFKIGEFWIKPVWEKSHFDDLNKTIYIDPSVAFGTGFHPTTRMILESFENIVNKELIFSAIDLGCGTGILSIYASKKGVYQITAIDNNNLAIEVTNRNLKINNIKNVIVENDDIFNHFPYDYDVIFANLYYNLLEKLFLEKKFWYGKYYFISGFIKEMEKRILKNIPNIVKIREKKYNESWCMILLER